MIRTNACKKTVDAFVTAMKKKCRGGETVTQKLLWRWKGRRREQGEVVGVLVCNEAGLMGGGKKLGVG